MERKTGNLQKDDRKDVFLKMHIGIQLLTSY